MNWRRVLFASGAGGKLLGSVNCGPQPQVVTQWPSEARAGLTVKMISVLTSSGRRKRRSNEEKLQIEKCKLQIANYQSADNFRNLQFKIFNLHFAIPIDAHDSPYSLIFRYSVRSPMPRIVAASEWDRIERGLKQRIQALNLFIDDLYHDQKIIKDKVVPDDLVRSGRV